MKLTFLGTRGEIDARTSQHRMHTALLVLWRRTHVMIDCGADWARRIAKLNPTAILITHAHLDHAGGLKNGVRKDMGLTNVVVMIPFCRTVEEGRQVFEAMRAHGLAQSENGLQVYAMCELPSNVVLAREFLEVFDGYSIGSNDVELDGRHARSFWYRSDLAQTRL